MSIFLTTKSFAKRDKQVNRFKKGARMVAKAFLRLPEVSQKIGWSGSTIYSWISPTSPYHRPEFPLPIKVGRSVRWLSSAVDDWVCQCVRTSSKQLVETQN